MFLKPREYFPIARQLHDPFDGNTYYVQAVIRNENKNETIATVNLTNEGNQLFVTRWQVPPDTSGEGFWLSIRTRVYTDSGYTTLSENYAQELSNYLVFERVRPLGGGSGGGDVEVNYEKIERMINKVFDERYEKPEAPEKTDLGPVLEMLRAVSQQVANIDIPTPESPEKTDLTPVLSAINRIEKSITKAIADKEIPETNLDPVISSLSELSRRLANAAGLERYLEMAPEIKSQIDDAVSGLKNLDTAMKEYLFMMGKKEAKESLGNKKKNSFDELFSVREQ